MIVPACAFCGDPVDTLDPYTYHRITGWERKALSRASRKGGSDIRLREALDEFAHPRCVDRAKDGVNAHQEAMW